MQQTDVKTDTAAVDEPAAQASPGLHQEIWAELERFQQLATQVSNWSGSMLGLAWLELRLALSNLPRIVGLSLALVPLTALTWISFSILVAWLAYAATGIAAIGLSVLFLMQLSVLSLCVWHLKRLRAQASMPETREQWRLFIEELKQTHQAMPREDNIENRH